MNHLMLESDAVGLEKVLEKLIHLTNQDLYDPFKELKWPDHISKELFWMSPSLQSIYGTEYETTLNEFQKLQLSHWEFVNFCSLNVTGIRELLLEMVTRLHTPGFELLSEYLHILIGEENEHMWYFSKFCLKYAGKIYPDRTPASRVISESDIANIIVFIRILVFEEIVDFYNRKMGKDILLPEFVQKINWLHHLDEGRHIKYGRAYVELFYKQIQKKYPEERLRELENTVKNFMVISVQKLYRREQYIDAGLENPGKMRKNLIVHPARANFNAALMAGSEKFFKKIGLFKTGIEWHQDSDVVATVA